MPLRRSARPSMRKPRIGGGWRPSSIVREGWGPAADRLATGAPEEPLARRSLAQGFIAAEVGANPAPEPLRLEHGAVAPVVVAHRRESLGKALRQRRVEIGPRGEHAVIIGRRRPDLGQSTFGHQALVAKPTPERAADRPCLGASIEDRANHLGLARAGIAMLADIAIETQRAVVAPLDQAFALEKVNRENGCMPAVAGRDYRTLRFDSDVGKHGDTGTS